MASAEGEPSACGVFLRLNAMVIASDDRLHRPQPEAALGTWALSGPGSRPHQERIDAARLEAISSVWRRISNDGESIRLDALHPYVLVLGSSVIMPPIQPEEPGKPFGFILPLVPDDTPTDPASESP